MSVIDEALRANATIANDYDPSRVKPPAPKIAIVEAAPQGDGAGGDRAGQVLQLHRRRGEHQGADSEGEVASVDLVRRSHQGVRVRHQHRAAQRSVPGRGDRHRPVRAPLALTAPP
jgi:hypothetical protein